MIFDLNKSKSQIALDRIVSREYIPVKQATATNYLGASDWMDFGFYDKMQNPLTNSKKTFLLKVDFNEEILFADFMDFLLHHFIGKLQKTFCKNVLLNSGLFLLTTCIPAFAIALFLRAVFQILFPDFPPNGVKICFGISCFIATPKSGFQNFPIEAPY